jgi:deoxyguanosine kinase
MVYLRASTDVLMQRITFRDRSYERSMDRTYIEELNEAYEAYFEAQDLNGRRPAAPVIVIDTNDLDFVKRPEDLGFIEDRIRQALKLPPFQHELPFQEPDGLQLQSE